jgi:putative tricarboxylic transport membrane protein
VKVQRTDFSLGLGAIALAAAYLYVASGIQESMLSDSVGAGGIPRVLGWAMAVLGLVLCLRSVSFKADARNAGAPPAGSDVAAAGSPWRPHLQALSLLAILVAYIVLSPYLGYLLSMAALLAAVAAYGGAAIDRNMLLISAAGGIALWLVFAKILGISMQASVLLERL